MSRRSDWARSPLGEGSAEAPATEPRAHPPLGMDSSRYLKKPGHGVRKTQEQGRARCPCTFSTLRAASPPLLHCPLLWVSLLIDEAGFSVHYGRFCY